MPAGQNHCPTCGHARAHPEKALTTGTELNNGEFSIGRVLGEGGFGITYKGAHKNLQRPVAIKELFPLGAVRMGNSVSVPMDQRKNFKQELDSFLQEARVIANLRSQSIVNVHSVFNENGTTYIVMEYLEGQTLEERIKAVGKVSAAETQAIALKASEALAEVHNQDLLHRDVKPANIVLTADGRTVLIDFGSARAFQTSLTARHTRILTEDYAAPEQYSTQARFGPYTDIFCLGATLYHALTGAPPPGALERLQDGKQAVDFPFAAQGPLYAAVRQALALRIENRPQNMDEFRALLGGGAAVAPASVAVSPRPSASPPGDVMAYPYEFQGQRYSRPSELATVLEQNWGAALDDWSKGYVTKWITRNLTGSAFERKIDAMLQDPVFTKGLTDASALGIEVNPPRFFSDGAVAERQLQKVITILDPARVPSYQGVRLKNASDIHAWIHAAGSDGRKAQLLDRYIENGLLLAHSQTWGPQLHNDLQKEIRLCHSHCLAASLPEASSRKDRFFDYQYRLPSAPATQGPGSRLTVWREVFKYLVSDEAERTDRARQAEADKVAMRVQWFRALVAKTKTLRSAGCAVALDIVLPQARRQGTNKRAVQVLCVLGLLGLAFAVGYAMVG